MNHEQLASSLFFKLKRKRRKERPRGAAACFGVSQSPRLGSGAQTPELLGLHRHPQAAQRPGGRVPWGGCPSLGSRCWRFMPTGPVWCIFGGSLSQGYFCVALKISLSQPSLVFAATHLGPSDKTVSSWKGGVFLRLRNVLQPSMKSLGRLPLQISCCQWVSS